MIVSRIAGGMGNQLFQYAAARSLSARKSVPLVFDISFYQANKLRKFELDYFCLPDISTNIEQVGEQNFYYYKEPHFHYDYHFGQDMPDYTYLNGFWQCEKYFRNIRDILQVELQVKNKYIGHLKLKAALLSGHESVAVHIRRGDYQSQSHKYTHGILSRDYYQKAIKLLGTKLLSPVFYFFSDDMEWVRENILIDYPHEFISGIVTEHTIEDFYLMCACRNFIIANSTFSWWPAWLSQHATDKQVIAPGVWLNNRLNTSDVVPDAWIKI